MALFFDQEWFDARLDDLAKSQADVAQALGVSAEAVAEIWKDQRELLPHDVLSLAQLLQQPAEEVADRAGVSTPVPSQATPDLAAVTARLDDLNARLHRLERGLGEIKALLLEQRSKNS